MAVLLLIIKETPASPSQALTGSTGRAGRRARRVPAVEQCGSPRVVIHRVQRLTCPQGMANGIQRHVHTCPRSNGKLCKQAFAHVSMTVSTHNSQRVGTAQTSVISGIAVRVDGVLLSHTEARRPRTRHVGTCVERMFRGRSKATCVAPS